MPYVKCVPVYDPTVRKLCTEPYEGHPHGCPNYGHSDRCPPRAPLLCDVYDMGGPFYCIYSTFCLDAHIDRMRVAHPDWSDRQLACVLYWQNTARKRLKREIEIFKEEHSELVWRVETTPEALGCNITQTLKDAGVIISWPATNVVYHVALAGLAKTC